tara:strand:+ start:504 stop:617 length:114 start_codon:yes stop_codon:yes gene_type:complete
MVEDAVRVLLPQMEATVRVLEVEELEDMGKMVPLVVT